jgi:hypothetical protein
VFALQNNYAVPLVLNYLQNPGSSGVVALANAVAEFWPLVLDGDPDQFAPMLASRLAPVIDSILAQHLGTLWVFRFLVIFAAAFFVPFFLFFLQTCRKNVGDGLIIPSELNHSPPSYVKERRLRRPALLPILRTDMSCQRTSIYDSRVTLHPQNHLYQDSWPHHRYD